MFFSVTYTQRWTLIFILTFATVKGFCMSDTEKVDTIKVYKINEVTVTEHNNKANVQSAAPLQILSASQIAKLNSLQVSDAVKFFSGVTVKDYGGIGGLKTISTRSLGAEHTAINYDGITVTDNQTGQIDIGKFSLDNIEMLTLNNGQNDNIFLPARSFASAAILNILTKVPTFNHKNFNGKANVKAGSFGMINPSFLLENKIKNLFSTSLNAEWMSANGQYPYTLHYSYMNSGLTSNEIRSNSAVRNLRMEANAYLQSSKKSSGFLKAYYYQSDRGLPGATIFYNDHAFSSQHLNDNTFFTQLHYQNNLSNQLAFQVNAKYQYGFVHYNDSASLNALGYEDSRYTQNEFYASVAMLYRIIPHFSMDISADKYINTMSAVYENKTLTDNFPDPIRNSLLIVSVGKYVSEQFMSTISLLRSQITERSNKTNIPVERVYIRYSPYASFSYKPFRAIDLRFRAFYKNIFRMPTFNDLYFGRMGNPDLKPENTNQFNLGGTYAFDSRNKFFSVIFTADAYKNLVQDKIVAIPTKNIFIWSTSNLGKVSINGIDISGEMYMKLSEKCRINIGGTYTYQQALDITSLGNETYKHQIPYTPRISGSGKIAFESSYINLGYTLLWSGARYAGYQNYAENRLTGYTDQGISASREFSFKKMSLFTKIEVLNLLNSNYEIIRYFPMPGRSFRATLSLKF